MCTLQEDGLNDCCWIIEKTTRMCNKILTIWINIWYNWKK
jgi:hypothetical protein